MKPNNNGSRKKNTQNTETENIKVTQLCKSIGSNTENLGSISEITVAAFLLSREFRSHAVRTSGLH